MMADIESGVQQRGAMAVEWDIEGVLRGTEGVGREKICIYT